MPFISADYPAVIKAAIDNDVPSLNAMWDKKTVWDKEKQLENELWFPAAVNAVEHRAHDAWKWIWTKKTFTLDEINQLAWFAIAVDNLTALQQCWEDAPEWKAKYLRDPTGSLQDILVYHMPGVQVVTFLLETFAKNKLDINLKMLISTAAYYYRAQVLPLFLNQPNAPDINTLHLNSYDPHRQPLLHRILAEAIAADSTEALLETIKVLLQHKANIQNKDVNGNTPLHIALQYPDAHPAVALLLENKASIHATNNQGDTPLHVGVEKKVPVEIIKQLLQHNPNLFAFNEANQTPMGMAAQDKEILCIFIAHTQQQQELESRAKVQSLEQQIANQQKQIIALQQEIKTLKAQQPTPLAAESKAIVRFSPPPTRRVHVPITDNETPSLTRSRSNSL